jgi:hypothetical protein
VSTSKKTTATQINATEKNKLDKKRLMRPSDIVLTDVMAIVFQIEMLSSHLALKSDD